MFVCNIALGPLLETFFFAQQQRGALGELALNIVVLSTLNYMIHCGQDAIESRMP